MTTCDRRNLRKLRQYSGRVNRMMSDGTFEALPERKRSRIVERIRGLYEDLMGIVPEVTLRQILAASAVVVLGLAGCDDGKKDRDTDTSSDVVTETDAGDTTGEPDVPEDTMTEPDVIEDPIEDSMEDPDATMDPDADPVEDSMEDPDATMDPDADPVEDSTTEPDATTDPDAITDPEADGPAGPSFAAPVTNPHGLGTPAYTYIPCLTLGDLDDDGDLDILGGALVYSGYYGGPDWLYWENTGTATTPSFGTPTTNPGGLATPTEGYVTCPELADIDDDGDLDVIAGILDYSGNDLLFYENTGTASAPAFAAPTSTPWGMNANTGYNVDPELEDIDDDGDLDLFIGGSISYYDGGVFYQENTGTASAPAFGTQTPSPFGIGTVYYIAFPAFTDLDDDGDLDLFMSDGYGDVTYFENTGTASVPAFTAGLTNPFGISSLGGYSTLAAADIDGDGDDDLVVGDTYGDIIIIENTSS